jgi:hypothetical protein
VLLDVRRDDSRIPSTGDGHPLVFGVGVEDHLAQPLDG